MHYIMNKDTAAIEIETAKILNWDACPWSLRLSNLTIHKIYKWLMHRALPLSRKNSEKIYKTVQLSRDNQELELMYLTHALSINDNYWVCNDNEISFIKYKGINLFENSLNSAMYLVALRGIGEFTITDKEISAEYTGQGTCPKCFVRSSDGLFIYKSGSIEGIKNELYACYIAEVLGAKTAHYDYETFNGVQCTKSKICTALDNNWETAFILSEYLTINKYTPQSFAEKYMSIDYANMIILDAIILNSDRHMKNWSFEFNTNDNKLLGLALNYDYNNAFSATAKTLSNLMFEGKNYMNVLKAGREAYRNIGTTLYIDRLIQVLNSVDIPINKTAMLNRVKYITGQKDTQRDCY